MHFCIWLKKKKKKKKKKEKKKKEKKRKKKEKKKRKKKTKEAKDAHKRGQSCPPKEAQVAHYLYLAFVVLFFFSP
jgi:hypothetical protein